MYIYIGMSTRGNDLNSELVKWIIKQSHRTDHQISLYLSQSNTSAMKAQSGLFKHMYSTDRVFDYALFMDTDVYPRVDVIDKLIATGKDVVTAPIWCFDEGNGDIHLNVHYYFENSLADRVYKSKNSGVEKVDSSSFSCLLVSRKVFDAFDAAKEDPILWSPLLDPKWQGHENDIIFFLKLKKLGIPAYVCWDATGGTHNRRVKLCEDVINGLILKRFA